MVDRNKLWRTSPNKNGKTKGSFILFYDTAEAVRTAFQHDTCKLGEWFNAILDYEMYGKEPTFEDAEPADIPILTAMFEITKSQLEINQGKWEAQCRRQAERRERERKEKEKKEREKQDKTDGGIP